MSVWSFLVSDGILSPSLLQKDAKTLHDVDDGIGWLNKEISKKVQSAINFYHVQRLLNAHSTVIASFDKNNLTEAKRVATLSSSVLNSGKALLSYGWYAFDDSTGRFARVEDGNYKLGAHAVIAYGETSGDYTKFVNDTLTYAVIAEDEVFDRCILIYDCAYPDGGDGYNLYYSSTTGTWSIPAHDIIATGDADTPYSKNNNAEMWATDSTDILNTVDYSTGAVSSAIKRVYPTMETSISTSYTVEVNGITYVLAAFGTSSDGKLASYINADITADADGEEAEATSTLVLPEVDTAFTVHSSSGAAAFAVTYADYYDTLGDNDNDDGNTGDEEPGDNSGTGDNSGSTSTDDNANSTTDKTDTPNTGDESNVTLWISVGVLSGAALLAAAVVLWRRRRTK